MLHKDLFYEISLHCKPYLFSINKELHSLYNDDLFKTILRNKFPNKKLFTTTNYLDLYKKYLSEGDIYSNIYDKTHKYKISGVKAQPIYNTESFLFCSYILNFNGELYFESIDEIKLIDTEVVDISSYGYIKNNEVYLQDNHHRTILKLTLKEQLLRIVCEYDKTWILVPNGLCLYLYKYKELKFYHLKDCVNIIRLNITYFVDINNKIYKFKDGNFEVIDHSISTDEFYIRDGKVKLSNKTVNIYNEYDNIIKTITNIKNIIADDIEDIVWFYIK